MAGWKYLLRITPQASPDGPAPIPVLSRIRTSLPDPFPRAFSSLARCHPVERPCTPAPMMTYRASVSAGLLPAFHRWTPVVLTHRRRRFDPGPQGGLWEFRVLLLQADPVGVPADQVSHQHLAGNLILAPLGNLEVDLQERVRVPVEYRRHTVFLQQMDILEPVDVLAGSVGHQIQVFDQGHVVLVGKSLPGEFLGVN